MSEAAERFTYTVARWSTIVFVALIAVLMIVRLFHFGPAEWVWRSLTWLRPQPFRR